MGFTSLEGAVRRRWKRVAQLAIDADELRSLRLAIALVCEAPQDADARERMRGIAAEHRAWEQLAPLLAAEVRLTRDPDVVAALDEESARARSRIEHPPQPLTALREAIQREPDNPEHLEMLAWSYYLAGIWTKAAEALEELATKVPAEHAILPLHAAARLYRNTGHTARAQTAYRAVVVRKPSNTEALIAISELVSDTPGLNHTSPFDPPVSDEVIESQAVLADVAARTPTADVVAPEPEPPPEPPKPRKRVQVFDKIDEAELDARFASVFDEGGPIDEPARPPAPKPRPAEAVEAVDRLESVEVEITHESIEEPEPSVAPPTPPPQAARPIAAIKLQPARVPRAATPPPIPPRLPPARPPPLPRAVTPPPIEPATEPASTDPALPRVVTPPPLPRDAIEVAIEQAMEVAIDAAMDDAMELAIDEAVASTLGREIEAAKADAREGRVPAAEQRLRALIARHPHETAILVSLVDLLRANDRLDDADRFLREAIEQAPADANAHRAALLHRHALVTAARGDGEQAHAMLREAHELHPMSLPITLALGESYFERASWGEACRHLAPVANHPDAPNFPRAAARGLVTAARAELELRRPNQATQHYQAALRIDPTCEPARRALAAK